ncbi:hypothetical protein ACSUZJ_23465 [Telluria sp. B2]
MNFTELLKRATPAPEPLFSGNWGTLFFRPDLGSQQEFVIGAVANIIGDQSLYIRWVPSLTRLVKLYGESTSAIDISGLLSGCELAMLSSFRGELETTRCATPHVRMVDNGFFSANNVEAELTRLLKRHAAAIWAEPTQRDDPMNDDWAYAEMLKAIDIVKAPKNIIIPGRAIVLGRRQLSIAFNNGRSYGSVVSARYANFSTIERHIFRANNEITTAHNLSGRTEAPALFVVLPVAKTSDEVAIRQRSLDFLDDIADAGVATFSSSEPLELAERVGEWAFSTSQ